MLDILDILIWIEHQRSVIIGLSLVHKVLFDHIYSFGRHCDFYILVFCLEIAYSSP